jgi:hypothetical protein
MCSGAQVGIAWYSTSCICIALAKSDEMQCTSTIYDDLYSLCEHVNYLCLLVKAFYRQHFVLQYSLAFALLTGLFI